MKLKITAIALLSLVEISSLVHADQEEFNAARNSWLDSIDRIEKKGSGDVSELENKGIAATREWESLPEETRNLAAPKIYRWWFECASICAKQGLYEKALAFYNREMAIRYGSGAILSGRTRAFFMDAIELESEIVGHLGFDGYPTAIDHFLMPVPLKQNGLSEFVAMESTADDDQNGILLPQFPKGSERKIIYLLAADVNGHYSVKDSIQVIGKAGKEMRIAVVGGEKNPTVALGGVTRRIELKNGIPTKYVPVQTPFMKLYVTENGFQEVIAP